MNYCEALDRRFETENVEHPLLFLAGGITGCPNWQAQVVEMLSPRAGTVLNPRRADFPIDDASAAEAQIRWEYDALRAADIIMFWFPAQQIQPIALFELGRWSFLRAKPIVVGADPQYPRVRDVEIQMQIVARDVSHTLLDTITRASNEMVRFQWKWSRS